MGSKFAITIAALTFGIVAVGCERRSEQQQPQTEPTPMQPREPVGGGPGAQPGTPEDESIPPSAPPGGYGGGMQADTGMQQQPGGMQQPGGQGGGMQQPGGMEQPGGQGGGMQQPGGTQGGQGGMPGDEEERSDETR